MEELRIIKNKLHKYKRMTNEHLEYARNNNEAKINQTDELKNEIEKYKPFYCLYHGVCKSLGIEKNILGYVQTLENQRNNLILSRTYWRKRRKAAEKVVKGLNYEKNTDSFGYGHDNIIRLIKKFRKLKKQKP